MSTRHYTLFVGIALLVAAVGFAVMPALLDYDAFIPVLLMLACTFAAIAVFYQGLSSD